MSSTKIAWKERVGGVWRDVPERSGWTWAWAREPV